MVNFIWLANDKLLKFYRCSHKNAPKQSLLHACGKALLAKPLGFWIANTLFHAPMLFSVDTINIFQIKLSDKVHHRSRVVTDSTS